MAYNYIKKISALLRRKNEGVIMPLILIFGSIFLILFGGTTTFILFELKSQDKRVAFEESLYIAEAGINYYQWCLNHELSDCETEKEVFDSQARLIGAFSLDINETSSCGETIQKKVISSGWTEKFPETKRKISVVYARPSVAKYSYMVNESVWAGDDRSIRGFYHSNGGVRMDGNNFSLVTSAAPQGEWICTESFGCSSYNCPISSGCRLVNSTCVCPGVFTTTNNSNPGLFEYPITPLNFEGFTGDLDDIKKAADANLSYFKPSKEINSSADGYHVKLKSNGTLEVWIITNLTPISGYSLEEGWHTDYFIINPNDEYLYNTYNINSSCGVFYFEDNLWIEGTLKGRLTIASANLITSGAYTDIVLPGSINYTTTDGSDVLEVIAERNILISPISPDYMVLRGIFIAQTGRFGRNHYLNNTKTLLQTFGAVVSYGRTGTQWTSGGQIVSGYKTREDYVDSNLIYGAPPFTPHLSPDFRIIKWEEIK